MSNKKLLKYTLLSALLFVLSISFIKSSFDVLKSKRRLDDLKLQIVAMNKEANDLEKSIEFKKSEEYIEEKARNDLSLIKPGESVYVVAHSGVLENSNSNVLGENTSGKDLKKDVRDKNWYSWYSLFFK